MPFSNQANTPARPARDADMDALSTHTAFELQTIGQLAALLPALRVATGMVIAALVLAALYFGRDLLIPLALATLFSFLLTPVVNRLKRWGLPRAAAAIVVVCLTLAALGAGGAYMANQASSLSAQLPTYQQTIRDKLAKLRDMTSGPSMWDGLISTFKTFEREVSRAPAGATPAAASGKPAPGGITKVEVVEPAAKPVQVVMGWLGRVSEPMANAGIVLLFVILILLDKGDLRDRALRLMGGNLHLATDALDEASERIGKYLRMQLLVNVSYGIPMAMGLWLIGVPGAFLWGVTAAVMRFIPYVGAMISAIFPLVLAFAVAPGWDMVLWTAGLILVLELISNNVIEPWLYGESTGLSTLSIILSATFWTALWGPIGLILATPLTVCLLVLGRNLPALKFLDMLLGSEPVLDPPHRLYQRLLASDTDDALELAQSQIEAIAGPKPDPADLARAVTAFYDSTAVPMLRIGSEYHADVSTSEHRLRLASSTKTWLKELIEDYPAPSYLSARPVSTEGGKPLAAPIHCVGARWEIDAHSAAMVAHALRLRGLPATNSQWPLGAQREELLDWREVQVVCLCTFNAQPQTQVRQLLRRLKRLNPGVRVVVAAWHTQQDIFSEEAARALGVADVVNQVESVVLRAQTMLQADAEMGWLPAPVPENDAERVQALHASGLQATALADVFRDAARQAVNAFDVPFAQVALVDRDWAHTPGSLLRGINGQPLEDGVPRNQALAAWVVADEKPFVVNDVCRDPRFSQNPALRSHGIQFYAGVPLRLKAGGPVLGSFELLDHETRDISADEIALLGDMAASLVQQALDAAPTTQPELAPEPASETAEQAPQSPLV